MRAPTLPIALIAAVLSGGALAANAPAREPRFVALVVAITNYEGQLALQSRLDEGARQMEAALGQYAKRAGYKDIRIKLLADRSPDGRKDVIDDNRILREFGDRAYETSAERDTLVFYFTGHGSRSAGKMRLYASTAREGDDTYQLDFNRLLERLQYSKAGAKLVFIDACQVLTEGDLAVHQSFYGASEMKEVRPQGTVIFYASSRGQPAKINKKTGIGYFTGELLRVMARDDGMGLSRDGLRTAVQLGTHLKKEVRREVAEQEMAEQEPDATLDGTLDYDLMPLIPRPATANGDPSRNEAPAQSLPGLRVTRNTRAGEKITSGDVVLLPANSPVPPRREQPWNFERDLRGACFNRSLTKDSTINWTDIELCGR